jgi:hypothetical protein
VNNPSSQKESDGFLRKALIASEISSVSVVALCSSDDDSNEASPKKASASANDPSPKKNAPKKSDDFQRNTLIAREISSVSVEDLCSSHEDNRAIPMKDLASTPANDPDDDDEAPPKKTFASASANDPSSQKKKSDSFPRNALIASKISSDSVVDLSDSDEDDEAPPKKTVASASANDPSLKKKESDGFLDLYTSDEDDEAPPKKTFASASANDPSPQKESDGFPRNALIASKTTKRPLQKNIILEAANLLPFSTEETLPFDLTRVQDLFLSDGQATPITVGWRWKSLLGTHLPSGSQLQMQSQAFVTANFKKNVGNRTGYKPTNLTENDEVVRTLCDGRYFLIQDKKPAPVDSDSNSLERNFDPSKFPDWAIFKNNMYVHPDTFVYEGLVNRLKPRKKKNNTQAKMAWKPKGRKKIKKIKKVYCFLDGSQSPIEAPPRASTKGPNGSTNFSLCHIEDG